MRYAYAVGVALLVGVLVSDVWFDVDYRLAANFTLTLMATLVTVFTVLYGVRSNWGANRIGRVFFTKCVFLSVVLWQGVISVWGGPDYPYRDVVRFTIYALGVVAYTPMIITLWCQQRRDRADRAEALEV